MSIPALNKAQRLKEPTNFTLPPDVREILESVAASMFEGNRSAALRYVVRDWNTLRVNSQNNPPARAG